MATQQPLLKPDHVSMTKHRLKKRDRPNPERIYLARWKKKARQRLSNGWSLLEHILAPDGEHPVPISRRDAVVAATLVQWFGTNVGLGFIWDCEQAIDKARDKDSKQRSSLHALKRADVIKKFEEALALAERDRVIVFDE